MVTMKEIPLKTFREFVAEAKQDGVYAAYHISPEIKEALAKHVKAMGIKNPCGQSTYHITTVYSKKPIEYKPSPEAITVHPIGYDLFGHPDKVLVLKVEHPRLHERFNEARKAGATWDYPNFQPHITLATGVDPDLDISTLPLPEFLLDTGPEYTEALSD